jgi:hypothetical protein
VWCGVVWSGGVVVVASCGHGFCDDCLFSEVIVE